MKQKGWSMLIILIIIRVRVDTRCPVMIDPNQVYGCDGMKDIGAEGKQLRKQQTHKNRRF